MLIKTLALLALSLPACVDAPSSGPLPEGRYQITWTNLDPAHAAPMSLVGQHQMVVHAGELVFDHVAIPLGYMDDQCACTEPVGDIPAFHICADDGDMHSDAISSWAFTATPMTAR